MRCRLSLAARARPVALVLMDVDGVMTDGGISLAGDALEAKTYDARDGVGLWIARRAGLRTGLISGRSSPAVARRAAELDMDEVHMKVRDKLAAYLDILRRRRLVDSQVCYIGDDLVDLPILARAGMAVAVADARPEVIRRARFVTRAPGGRGAIREVIDAILKAQGRWEEILGWFEGSKDPAAAAAAPRGPAPSRNRIRRRA